MKNIMRNGEVHHPLGGVSCIWKKKYVGYILEQTSTKNEVKASIRIQPNGTPHFGTLTATSLSFSLAKQLKEAGKQTIGGGWKKSIKSIKQLKFINIEWQK